MRVTAFIPIFAAVVIAQAPTPSASEDAFPQTTFLRQTNSLGVVTGQPAPATSMPTQAPVDTDVGSVNTDVGTPATLPALAPGIWTLPVQGTKGLNSTQTIVVSANNSTTQVISTIGVGASSAASGSGARTTPTGSGAGRSGSENTATGTAASGSQSTGAAATMRAVAGGVAGVGAFVAAFL